MKTEIKTAWRKAKLKALTLADKGLQKCQKAVAWCKEHPEEALTIGTSTLYLGCKARKYIKNNQEEHKHDKEVYDPSRMMWHPVRRKLSYNEELYYKNAIRRGDDAVEVLQQMRLYR